MGCYQTLIPYISIGNCNSELIFGMRASLRILYKNMTSYPIISKNTFVPSSLRFSNQWLINWLPIDYLLITNWFHWCHWCHRLVMSGNKRYGNSWKFRLNREKLEKYIGRYYLFSGKRFTGMNRTIWIHTGITNFRLCVQTSPAFIRTQTYGFLLFGNLIFSMTISCF